MTASNIPAPNGIAQYDVTLVIVCIPNRSQKKRRTTSQSVTVLHQPADIFRCEHAHSDHIIRFDADRRKECVAGKVFKIDRKLVPRVKTNFLQRESITLLNQSSRFYSVN